MSRWIKIKDEELRLLLDIAGKAIRSKIIGDVDLVIEASHYLKSNQKKLKVGEDESL
jgi:hypothetical protein